MSRSYSAVRRDEQLSSGYRCERSNLENRAQCEEMREARLQGLEEMAAKLIATARELPPGQDHHNALREIGRFRAQIAALKGADPNASVAASGRWLDRKSVV